MINFKIEDPKIKSAILMQIQEFEKRSYNQQEMNCMIHDFRNTHGEEAVNELVSCYEQYVAGKTRK